MNRGKPKKAKLSWIFEYCGYGGFMKTCKITDKDDANSDQIKKIRKILFDIPSEEELYNKSELFKALSDPTRLKILHLLQHGELCVCEIIIALEKPQSTISHHLNVLKNAGFIRWRKEGVWIHYRLSDPNIIDITDRLCKSVRTPEIKNKGEFL